MLYIYKYLQFSCKALLTSEKTLQLFFYHNLKLNFCQTERTLTIQNETKGRIYPKFYGFRFSKVSFEGAVSEFSNFKTT